MKIKINPKYEEMRSFIERIPDVFEQEGRCIFQGRNVIKAFIAQFEVKLKDAANKLQIEPEIIPYMIDDEKADIEKWVLANGNKPLVSQKRSAELAGLVKDTEEDYKTLQEESDRDKQFAFFEPTPA